MDRRTVLTHGVAAGLVLAAPPVKAWSRSATGRAFPVDFAPHIGQFDALSSPAIPDQLAFVAAAGFRALEDNDFIKRPAAEQALIGETLARLDMRMGVIVANFGTMLGSGLPSGDAGVRQRFLDEVRAVVESAKRCGARWITVVAGAEDSRVDRDRQLATTIETMKQGDCPRASGRRRHRSARSRAGRSHDPSGCARVGRCRWRGRRESAGWWNEAGSGSCRSWTRVEEDDPRHHRAAGEAVAIDQADAGGTAGRGIMLDPLDDRVRQQRQPPGQPAGWRPGC